MEEGTRTTGNFFRVWMDVKAAFTGNNRATILDSCEFGEDKALETFESVLENREKLGPNHITLLQKQQAALRADHDKVRAFRAAAKD